MWYPTSPVAPLAPGTATSAGRRLDLLEEASRYLLSLIQGEATPEQPLTRAEAELRGRERLARMHAILQAFGDPQKAYPVVHVAGTSGKGSVCAFVASICNSAGIRTGAHLTPYLQTPLEKLAVEDRFAPPEEFSDLVEWIKDQSARVAQPVARALGRDPELGAPDLQPRYGSAWVALTFEYFRRKRVDLAVVETGVGGRFDLTNVVIPAVAAVTSIGLDHMATLGPTLADIAYHKAGVFKPGVPAVAIERHDRGSEALKHHAAEIGADLRLLRPGRDYSGRRGSGIWPRFHYHGRNLRVDGVELGLAGTHQIDNAAVACAIADALRESGLPITHAALAEGLRRTRLPGRLEVMPGDPLVILDGAHNPDKAAALATSLRSLSRGRRLVLVLGVLGYKAFDGIVASLAPIMDRVVVTQPHVYMKSPLPAADLGALLEARGLQVSVQPEPMDALDTAQAWAGPDGLVCVTGSLYLVGQVRERWYSAADIALQGTPWPDRPVQLAAGGD